MSTTSTPASRPAPRGATVPSPWLTIPQAAAYLQMREGEMRKKVKSGEIVSYLRGKKTVFVHTSDLDTWMRSLPSGAAPIALAAKPV